MHTNEAGVDAPYEPQNAPQPLLWTITESWTDRPQRNDSPTKYRRVFWPEPHATHVQDFPDFPPFEQERAADISAITAKDRLDALLSHLLSWEGLASIATVCGIIAATLAGSGITAEWAATAIVVLTLVNVVFSKIVALEGHGALATVLLVKGKLDYS